MTTRRKPKTTDAQPEPVTHDQFISVTTVLKMIPMDALVPWAAGKVADAVIRDVEQSIEWARDMLVELRHEADVPDGAPTPMRLRDKAEAEAWRRLKVAQDTLKDRRKARKNLVDTRWDPEVDPDTGGEYAFTATGLGTACHDVWDRWLITGTRPTNPHPELAPYLDQLDEWMNIWQPDVELAEATVVNPKVGYAGRTDACLRLDVPELDLDRKLLVITDLKTRRDGFRKVRGLDIEATPWPEGGYQTAAYAHGTHVISWADAQRLQGESRGSGRYYYVDPSEWTAAFPMPKVEAAVVLLVTPERATLHRVNWRPDADEWAWDAFRYYLGAARMFHSKRHGGLIGPAMVPPYRPDHRTHGDTDLEARLRDSVPAGHVHDFDRVLFGGGLACTICDAVQPLDADRLEPTAVEPGGEPDATVLAFPAQTD
jgi:hypothetical protein